VKPSRNTAQSFVLTPMGRRQSRRVAREIAAMSRHLIERGLGWSWREERILRQLHRPDTLALIAHHEKRLLGFGIMRYRESQAHLLLLGVKPDVQRQGIGRALLEWLEACATTDGVERIVLEVLATNRGGRAFYRSLGYEHLHHLPRYYRGRAAGIRLTKRLPAADVAASVDGLPGPLTQQLQGAARHHTDQLKAAFADGLTGAEATIWRRRIDTDAPASLFALQAELDLTTAQLKAIEAALLQRWQAKLSVGT